MTDIKGQLERAIRIVSKHPLAKSLPSSIIKQWLIDTARVDPKRIAWHALRTLGIGGSEIFKAVVFHRAVKASAKGGHYDAYTMSSIQDVVKGKLFLSAPSKPDQNMKRGILNEPIADHVFLELLASQGKKVEVDRESSMALRKYANPKHPWHKYNEDKILIIDGERTLIDYKVPSPDQIGFKSHVEEDYVFQLHSGLAALNASGIKVDKLLLVKLNVIDCEVYPIEVEIDKSLCTELLQAGDYVYNNYILKNRLPEYQPSLSVDYTLSDLKKMIETNTATDADSILPITSIQKLSHKFALAKTMSTAAAEYSKQLSTELINVLSVLPIDLEASEEPSCIVVGGVEINYQEDIKLDEPALLAVAAKHGVDTEAFTEVKYDIKRLAAHIKSIASETDVASFTLIEAGFNAVCTRKKKGITADALSAIKGVSQEWVEASLASIDSPGAVDVAKSLEDEIARTVDQRKSKRDYMKRRWADAISTLTESSDALAHIGFGDDEQSEEFEHKP